MNSVVKCVQLCTVNRLHPYNGTDNLTRSRDQGQGWNVGAIVVTSGAVHYVPRRGWVFIYLLGRAAIDGRFAFVEVLVAVQDKVGPVLEQGGCSNTIRQSVHSDVLTYQGRWPAAMTQGVVS